MRVECSDCGAVADPLQICRCGGLPEFVLEPLRLDPVGLRRLVRERRASYEPLFASGVWRWRELLPAIPAESIVSLAEGNVPLYGSEPGARYAGVDRLAYLHLGMNPTGSFKDLGMTVAISAAKASRLRAAWSAPAPATPPRRWRRMPRAPGSTPTQSCRVAASAMPSSRRCANTARS